MSTNNADFRILLSAYNVNEDLVDHFRVIDISFKTSSRIIEEIYQSFHTFMINRIQFISCKFMILDPKKEGIEYSFNKGRFIPLNDKLQLEIFYARSANCIEVTK